MIRHRLALCAACALAGSALADQEAPEALAAPPPAAEGEGLEDVIDVEGRSAQNNPTAGEMNEALHDAVQRGFAYLRGQQNLDGSVGDRGRGRYGKHVGITALCALAWMSAANTVGSSAPLSTSPSPSATLASTLSSGCSVG